MIRAPAAIEAMAADYVNEMRKQRPAGPYFLGALCASVLIAIAMARMLRDAGEGVLPLLLLDPPERPFPMADCMLRSHVRVAKVEHSRVTRVFTGRVERFDVAKTHSEILNPRNPAVAKALAPDQTKKREAVD